MKKYYLLEIIFAPDISILMRVIHVYDKTLHNDSCILF